MACSGDGVVYQLFSAPSWKEVKLGGGGNGAICNRLDKLHSFGHLMSITSQVRASRCVLPPFVFQEEEVATFSLCYTKTGEVARATGRIAML